MEKTGRTFDTRAFATLMIALSGLGLPITGIVNHYYGLLPLTVARHAWMTAHNVLGILFVAFAAWHALLNRRVLWRHVKGLAGSVPLISREALAACLVTAAVLCLFVGHAFHAGDLR